MVKIRLRRLGQKKAPFYRIVVADANSPRDGRFIEEIGTYDPTKDPSEYHVNEELAKKSLVDHPDEVVVTESENDKALVVELRVAQTDMGKVIGKQGRIAKAIRSVVKAAASKENKKVIVEIVQ